MTAIGPFKVTQGHRFWYQSKARMRLPIIVSELSGHIGQIIAFELTGVPLFNSLVRGESVNSGLRNFDSKLETSVVWCVNILRY